MLLVPGPARPGGALPTQGSHSQGQHCSKTSASPCLETEPSWPCSPQPGQQTHSVAGAGEQRGVPERGGQSQHGWHSHDHNVMSPQPQMPHGDSGQTFVSCGLFLPLSPPPNLSCAKCWFLGTGSMTLLITHAEQLALHSLFCARHKSAFTAPTSTSTAPLSVPLRAVHHLGNPFLQNPNMQLPLSPPHWE